MYMAKYPVNIGDLVLDTVSYPKHIGMVVDAYVSIEKRKKLILVIVLWPHGVDEYIEDEIEDLIRF